VAGLVAGQAVIGIVTLLALVPMSLGLLHQAFAMVVLAMATVHWRLLTLQR
jgi:cytochrome c oxidase assembly protein subunit 15